MCLDQQPTLVCAQMGLTNRGSNPGPLRGQYHARGVVCNESCLHKHAHCHCLANMLPTHHVHFLRHLQGRTVVPTTYIEHPMLSSNGCSLQTVCHQTAASCSSQSRAILAYTCGLITPISWKHSSSPQTKESNTDTSSTLPLYAFGFLILTPFVI